jgi:hypothetical protein
MRYDRTLGRGLFENIGLILTGKGEFVVFFPGEEGRLVETVK